MPAVRNTDGTDGTGICPEGRWYIMDNKDIIGVGSDIMNAVDDAVNRGDFSGLNETLRNVTGAAAGTAADALHGLQEHLQGSGSGGGQGYPAGGPQQERTYGHAGRSSGNLTEEYMNRAPGARHHTRYTSRISPFLQRKVSRSGGIGKIIGGVTSLVFAGIAFLETVASGFLGLFSPVGSEVFSAWSIVSLIFCVGLGILGGILIKKGQERRQLVREYYEYGKVAGTSEYIEISKLARAVGESRETVLNNLEKMMSEEMLPAAWFDRQKTTLMLSEDIYNEYLRLERERLEHEAEEAKARMAAQGAGPAPAAAAQVVDDDLKLRPEDDKLPSQARAIVEEGLLYIGKIRNFNRDIGDEEISSQLAHLEITMKRIIDQVRKDPSSASNLRRLMVYYLPTTMKLLEAYGELDRQPVEGENIISTKQEIREALGTINDAFERLLDSMFQDMAWDISSDISVMKTMMEQDGLTGEGIRQTASGRPASSEQTVSGTSAQPQSQPSGYMDGYTEGYTEGYSEESGAAQAAAPPQEAAEESAGGIHLTFGE